MMKYLVFFIFILIFSISNSIKIFKRIKQIIQISHSLLTVLKNLFKCLIMTFTNFIKNKLL